MHAFEEQIFSEGGHIRIKREQRKEESDFRKRVQIGNEIGKF